MAEEMSWLDRLRFPPPARDTLCIIEGHFQLDLFSPSDAQRTRVALDDGRLYQYMRIMHKSWTNYKVEILLLTAAAMNVGAHLNFKFWSALDLLCCLNEAEGSGFCDVQTTRMLAAARGLYANFRGSDEEQAVPFDFEILGEPDHLPPAAEIIKAQKSGSDQACKPWPKDDVDDEDCELANRNQRIASWRRCPIERSEYWDAVEATGAGLPNFPASITLPTRPKVKMEVQGEVESSLSSLSEDLQDARGRQHYHSEGDDEDEESSSLGRSHTNKTRLENRSKKHPVPSSKRRTSEADALQTQQPKSRTARASRTATMPEPSTETTKYEEMTPKQESASSEKPARTRASARTKAKEQPTMEADTVPKTQPKRGKATTKQESQSQSPTAHTPESHPQRAKPAAKGIKKKKPLTPPNPKPSPSGTPKLAKWLTSPRKPTFTMDSPLPFPRPQAHTSHSTPILTLSSPSPAPTLHPLRSPPIVLPPPRRILTYNEATGRLHETVDPVEEEIYARKQEKLREIQDMSYEEVEAQEHEIKEAFARKVREAAEQQRVERERHLEREAARMAQGRFAAFANGPAPGGMMGSGSGGGPNIRMGMDATFGSDVRASSGFVGGGNGAGAGMYLEPVDSGEEEEEEEVRFPMRRRMTMGWKR